MLSRKSNGDLNNCPTCRYCTKSGECNGNINAKGRMASNDSCIKWKSRFVFQTHKVKLFY